MSIALPLQLSSQQQLDTVDQPAGEAHHVVRLHAGAIKIILFHKQVRDLLCAAHAVPSAGSSSSVRRSRRSIT
jgi:hypothetical protein